MRTIKSAIPHVFSDGTNKTYAYCLDRWYSFTGSKPSTRWNDDELEKRILRFIAVFRREEKSLATLSQHLCALSAVYGSPRVRTDRIRAALKQYAYDFGQPNRKASAIGIEQLTAMVLAVDSPRNKAILTVGWSAALRSAEIIAIRRSHLELTTEGFTLLIPRSKTDQVGEGKTIPLPYFHVAHSEICPARNLERYLLRQTELFQSNDSDFLLFPLTTRSISRIVARSAELARLPAKYSSHSLRRGLATTAAQHGVDDRVIMRHGRWTTRKVVDGYVDDGTLWSRTALDFLR